MVFYYMQLQFCNKVFKLVKDIDGKKPDNFKDCWRWLRQMINDFVQLKKVSGEYQKILSKVDTFFN